ncbi:MAG: DUF3788 domain-containing protein [Candidatus Krumholzibacteria bacterium]|nr:DUF3788 domain-containing protein [Candidatus Krumholzibacteria bacterium]
MSALDDKSSRPNQETLSKTLGKASALWGDLLTYLASEYEPLTEDWHFPGKNYGWGLRVKQKKRTILYMTPCAGHFLVSFALGEKAVRAAHESRLSDSVLKLIDDARQYAEGRGVRIEVRNRGDVEEIKRLAAIKMAT